MLNALLVLILGMTGVLAFLASLVGIMTAITTLFPAPVRRPAVADGPSTPAPHPGAIPAPVVAAIHAAIVAFEADASRKDS